MPSKYWIYELRHFWAMNNEITSVDPDVASITLVDSDVASITLADSDIVSF